MNKKIGISIGIGVLVILIISVVGFMLLNKEEIRKDEQRIFDNSEITQLLPIPEKPKLETVTLEVKKTVIEDGEKKVEVQEIEQKCNSQVLKCTKNGCVEVC